jgi:hypothetical protein
MFRSLILNRFIGGSYIKEKFWLDADPFNFEVVKIEVFQQVN